MVKNNNMMPPADGSIMLLNRNIGQIPYAANQTRKFDLKLQPNMLKNLLLHFTLISDSWEPDTSTICPMTGPIGIVRQVEVRASNGVLLKSIEGQALTILNSYEHKATEFRSYPLGGPYGQPADFLIEFDLLIPFEDITNIVPERTVLNTNEFSELTISVTWGSEYDICCYSDQVPPVPLKGGSVNLIALERVPISMDDELLNRQRMVDTMQQQAAVGSQVIFDLPENTLLKTLLFYVELEKQFDDEITKGPVCRLPYPGAITSFQVEDNNGAHVIRSMNAVDNLSEIKDYFGLNNGLDRFDAGVFSNDPGSLCSLDDTIQKHGVNVVEFDREHDFTTCYSTIGVNRPRLLINLNNAIFGQTPPPGYTYNWTVKLLQRQIVTPAIVTR